MSRVIQNVASVRFEINARQASAAMEALRGKADELNSHIATVEKQIADLGNVAPDHQGLLSYRQQLKELKSDLNDVNKTIKDYTRGVKAADELLKAAEVGNMESLSMKAIKAGQNGLKKRIENIQPDTLNAEELKAYRIIKQVIEEADGVVNKFKTDAAGVIQTLRDGGTVSERAMKQARDGVKSLMESYEEGSKENREFAEQYEFLAAKVIEFGEAQRRAAGEIVNADDARREAVRLTKEGVEASKREAEQQQTIIDGTKQQIHDYELLRQVQQQGIDQTQQQIKANQQQEDSLRSKISLMKEEGFYLDKNGELVRNDINARVNELEKEKESTRQNAEQQQAAAQIAQNAANQKREAFEQTSQAVEQLDGEVKQLREELEKMAAEPVKPKVDSSDVDGLNQKLEELQGSLERVQQMKSTAQEKIASAKEILGDTDKPWNNERVKKALEEDRITQEQNIEKLNAKWDEYWEKQEKNAREFAAVLNKAAMDDVDWDEFYTHVTGPNAEMAKSWYRVQQRNMRGVDYWGEDSDNYKELVSLRASKKLGSASDGMLEELKLLEALKRKWDEYQKALNKAREDSPKYDAAYTELDNARTEIIQQERLLEAYTEHERQLKEQISETEKLTQAQQQSAQADLLSQKEQQLGEMKDKRNKQEKEYQQAQDEADKKQQQANETQTKAIQLEQQHTDATKEANDADKEREQQMQQMDQQANKLSADNEKLTATLQQQQTQQQATDRAIAEGHQTIADAEKKKAQAGELSAKQMSDAIAALEEENRVIGESNPKWAENNRLIGQYTQRLGEMKQKSAELRGEIMSLDDALKMSNNLEEGASVEQMEQAVKTLTEARRKATDTEKFDQYGEALDKISAKLKEQTSEWMTLAQAREIAEQAGKNYYMSGDSQGFTASPEQIQKATAALERQREVLIKSIKAKRDNKEATDAEEKELADLTKKLKDLKFEQDNLNMSQEKMRMLMKQPTEAVSLDELRGAIKRADGELKRMEGSLGENAKEYKDFAKQVKAAKLELKEMEGQAKANTSAWSQAISRLKSYVGVYLSFNIVLQKVKATMGDLMVLSDKMGEVRKTTGFTADEVGRLSDNLAKLDTRTSLTGLMEFSSLAGSIGLKTQEAVQGFTEAANMIAVSLPEMGNEASRTLMKIADATGDLEKNGGNVRETLERVGSTIIALRANSAAAAGPITDFVSRVGAVGAQAGISIDQIAALGATVDALGGRVEMSATALSRMIPAIKNNSFDVAKAIGMTEEELKGKTGMEQMVAIFHALHDSVKGFDSSTEEGMNAMADSVEKALGRSTSMQEVMKQLNQQGARAGIVFGLLSQNVGKLEEQLNTASNAYEENIALMDEYNKMNDTTAAKWEKLKNQIEEFFVSDSSQRFLGGIIDTLRRLVDFLVEDGPIGSFFRWSLAYLVLFKAKWAEAIGTAIISLGKFLLSLRTTTAATQANATATTWATTSTVAYGDATERATLKTNLFSKAWGKLNTTMKANIITAVAMALVWLGTKLWDASEKAKEAAAEVGRFNQKLSDEKKALDDLFAPLNKSNIAQEERRKLISEINSKYSRYLGFMLSETTAAIKLADAHALIAKRIREEAYEKRILEQEDQVRNKHSEDVNAAYGRIEEKVREGKTSKTDVDEVSAILKEVIDRNLGSVSDVKEAGDIGDNRYVELSPAAQQELSRTLNTLVNEGKLSQKNVTLVTGAVMRYAVEAKEQYNDMQQATANTRADIRNVQRGIKSDVSTGVNEIVNGIKNFGKKPVMETPSPSAPKKQQFTFSFGQQGGSSTPSWTKTPGQQNQPQTTTYKPVQMPTIDKKNIEQVKQYVEMQDQLRGFLQANAGSIDEQTRKTAEMYLESEESMKELRALIPSDTGNGDGGGGGINPYGDYNKVTSPYSEWNGDDLVKRRKEMLERVKALANGADVQAVLSEDAKFISEAVRKNITTTEQAIEWYNTERLKIQDALHAKHLTNTGDWLDPKKGAKRAKKVVLDDMKYYMDELDAYYTERKAKIQEAQNDEEISEAEARNRTLANEAEWRQRRAELQQLYAKKSEKVAKEEQDAIFDILSDRTGESIGYIQKDIAQTVKFIEAVGTKNKAAMDRIFGDLDKDIETDFLRQRNAIGKHMKAIEDIINKENPFSGIVENLRKNLGTMDVLLTDIKDEEERTVDKEIERTMFIMEQSTKGYSLTWEEMMREMAERGWQAWADAINNDTALQTGLMHQVTKVYEAVQDAIKKEAAELKKQADIMWSNILLPGGDGRTTVKDAFEQTIGALGVQEGKVSRANSLIGAGQASERVADKLAIQQMKVQLAMQQYQYNLMRKQGQEKIEMLRTEAQLQEELGEMEKARALRMQADNAEQAKNLAIRKEQNDLLKQQEDIIAKTEESQNRLYSELREWAGLLTSGIQSVMEANAAGSEEYYNELAKLNLTGKGGPGAGTYVIIDNAGTSDATAHYEYLDERQALEREREIERENAVAEAWEKMWDDLNMKLSETITDQLNAMLQNQSIDANTQATLQNTEALMGLNETVRSDGFRLQVSGFKNNEANGAGQTGANAGLSAEDIQEWKDALGDNPMDLWMQQSNLATQDMIDNNKKIQQSTQTMFAKMTLAANMYGAAYQAMSNDNLSMTQKFEMMALQAVGNYAIGALTTEMASASAKAATDSPGVLGTLWNQLGWAAAPVFAIFTGLLGGLMGLATSKVGKAKSTIAQATGTSVGAGRLATGMLTYAEGNVNEFTDPKSLTPGRSYNVDAADGNTYRARYMGANPKTHITNGPEFHLVGEKGREAIIDAHTTRLMQTDDTGIWQAIQTLYNGRTLNDFRRRTAGHRGVRAFADGNLEDFDDMIDGGSAENTGLGGIGMEQMAAFQASLDRNSAIMERLAEDGIEAFVSPYGKRGIVNGYDTYKKEAKRHGEKHL